MRGLKDAAGLRPALITGGAVTAMAAAAGLLLAGCGASSEGVRKEGPAQTQSAAKSPSRAPSASATPVQVKIDAIKLIKSDPKVSDQIKKNLKPCVKDQYPVDVTYGQLTGSSRPDVVVNVLTCGDSFGIGSYVYRPRENAQGDGPQAYENVFTAEQSPVYADIDRKELTITRQVYGPGDAVCCPSGEDVVTYEWSGDTFKETGRTHTDYNKVGNTGKVPSEGTEG
ncbi:lipoprotein CseA [Streptomyces mashuensis]|uniref:Lipoprotein CseA n=1 Tax=Streptomyces mashuensis TaxID=33904 RepID=A0A919B859_9ACTN|nr:LppP/LprE family lipoprotein [Streptomyces mashuensis]GHF63337.1 lipoprotein CseA [Streptomyces mashuensis]